MKEKDLLQMLKKEVDNSNGEVVIMAGHFALIYDKNSKRLIPAIFQDVKNRELSMKIRENPYMGYFPLETWKIGISLIKSIKKKNKEAKLSLFVNDWQWVKDISGLNSTSLRENFYKSAELPDSFKIKLKESNLNEDIILAHKDTNGKIINQTFFSEKKLRNRYTYKYAKVCNLNNKCAEEYVPFLDMLEKLNVAKLISFIPKTCKNSIVAGTKKGKKDLKLKIEVINVFVNGIYNKSFWEEAEVMIEK